MSTVHPPGCGVSPVIRGPSWSSQRGHVLSSCQGLIWSGGFQASVEKRSCLSPHRMSRCHQFSKAKMDASQQCIHDSAGDTSEGVAGELLARHSTCLPARLVTGAFCRLLAVVINARVAPPRPSSSVTESLASAVARRARTLTGRAVALRRSSARIASQR